MSKICTAREEKFAVLLFRGMKQREAYVEAGYSPQKKVADTDSVASRLANSPKVRAKILQLREHAENLAVGSVVERKKKLTEIYRATVADFVDEKGNLDIKNKETLRSGAIAEIITETLPYGAVKTRLKLRDPVAAIEAQNKMERIGAPENQVIAQDNRVLNIIVQDEKSKEMTKELMSKIGSWSEGRLVREPGEGVGNDRE